MKVKIKTAKEKRVKRVRMKIKESGRGLKLVVFRSNRHVSGQIVSLFTGKTLLTVKDTDLAESAEKQNKVQKSFEVGKEIAKKARKLNLKNVVFDKGSFKYHGRIKALAEGARSGGLNL